MFEITFTAGYTEISGRDWLAAVEEAVKIAEREHTTIESIKYRPDSEPRKDDVLLKSR